ncbi:MAG: phytanoyl-CoA dioxygenase family protein [Gammaproteobacteria bacterium]|nr:phytanoyl-CoA dioxygenase family protein [Gammaproteobacteria bacterium]
MWLRKRESAITVERFAASGLIGPVRIFDKRECREIETYFNKALRPTPLDWPKGHAASDYFIYRLATRRSIIDIVSKLLGEDIILWGASLIEKKPGGRHQWHVDIECTQGTGLFASAWIGISYCSRRTAPTFLIGSHRFDEIIQKMEYDRHLDRKSMTDRDIVNLARTVDPGVYLETPYIVDGEAVFFDGRIWHASFNAGRKHQKALLLQYASADSVVRIPDLKQRDWPFIFKDDPLPPVISIRGRPVSGINRIVSAPSPDTMYSETYYGLQQNY